MVAMSTLTAKEAWRERMRAQRHIRPHVNPLQNQYTDATLPANFAADAFAYAGTHLSNLSLMPCIL